MELLVGDVFRNIGFNVRVTAYSNDDGIDLFVLDGKDDKTVGVQVKRYRNKIEAKQIRSFAGALVLNGLTRGVFVTTSGYTKGASNTAQRYLANKVDIDLWDSPRFYEALKLIQRPMYEGSDDPSAPFYDLCMDFEQLRNRYRAKCKSRYGKEMG
jgi:restriction system protein